MTHKRRPPASAAPDILCAAADGRAERVAELLAQGASPRAALPDGRTPLMFACSNGHPACAEILAGASWDLADEQGRTALHHACSYGHPECVAVLLAHPAARALARRADSRGATPLMAAASRGSAASVALLADAWSPRARCADGLDALGHAARAGEAECARLLLTIGAESEPSAMAASDLLSLAAESADPAAIELFAALAPTSSASTAASKALIRLASSRSSERLLLCALSPRESTMDSDRQDAECVAILLRFGADPAAVDEMGWSAGRHAASKGSSALALALFDAAPAPRLASIARSHGHIELSDALRARETARAERSALARALPGAESAIDRSRL